MLRSLVGAVLSWPILCSCSQVPSEDTGEEPSPPAWLEGVPQEPHVSYTLQGWDLLFERYHRGDDVFCDDWTGEAKAGFEISGGPDPVYVELYICQVHRADGRLHVGADEVSLWGCRDNPAWFGKASEEIGGERALWATLPWTDEEIEACWLDMHYDHPELAARFQCPHFRFYNGAATADIALTEGTLRCTVEERE